MQNRSAREVRQHMIALLTQAYGQGEPPAGEGIRLDLNWGSDNPIWTGPEVAAALGFVLGLFLQSGWDAETAHAGGRPPDVAGFLRRQAMFVAEQVTEEPISDGRVFSTGEIHELDIDTELQRRPESEPDA